MRLPERVPIRTVTFAAALGTALVLLAASCGGDGGTETDPAAWSPQALEVDADAPLAPILVNSSLGTGRTRLAWALLDVSGRPVADATASARLYRLGVDSDTGDVVTVEFVRELPLVARRMSPSVDHVHANGTLHVHAGEQTAVYTAEAALDQAGWWGASIQARSSAGDAEQRITFLVHDRTPVPAVGDPAPRTRQPVLADVDDPALLDSSTPPRPVYHQLTVDAAIATGKPVVVAFASPRFCQSRLCGPVLREAVDPIASRFGEAIAVVHIEPFDLAQIDAGEIVPVPAMAEWGLATEPWVFVLDRAGVVAARFEGIVEAGEIAAAVERALSE